LKKRKKKRKKKREKLAKKRKKNKEENNVNYCCNPQCFVCEGTVIPPHHLKYVVIAAHHGNTVYVKRNYVKLIICLT
jgi:acetyl/propionyl-CoA carboxylase alpha subunit